VPPELNWADRALLAILLGAIPKARRQGLRLLVTLDTMLRWHRDIVRRRWALVLRLAMRGDFKGRKRAGGRIQNDDQHRPEPRYWHRYARDLEQVIAEGRFAELAYPDPQPADPWTLVPEYARKVPGV